MLVMQYRQWFSFAPTGHECEALCFNCHSSLLYMFFNIPKMQHKSRSTLEGDASRESFI